VAGRWVARLFIICSGLWNVELHLPLVAAVGAQVGSALNAKGSATVARDQDALCGWSNILCMSQRGT
jgi:hypothetical protein